MLLAGRHRFQRRYRHFSGLCYAGGLSIYSPARPALFNLDLLDATKERSLDIAVFNYSSEPLAAGLFNGLF